uniref:Spore wall protein 1 isoform X1 n=1 Tax=Diabrotica virgifera virgifera TaxID=50390 RepID=A0A6P7F0U9_DIAVI
MTHLVWTCTVFFCLLAVLNLGECKALGNDIDTQQKEFTNQNVRNKRAVDVVTGVKNAVLGFVFNKIDSFLEQKTRWIDQLDKQNIAKNEAAGIHPPADPVTSLSSVISGAIGHTLQASAPLLNVVTGKLGGLSSGGGGGGFSIGSLLSKGLGSSSGGSSGGGDASHDDDE